MLAYIILFSCLGITFLIPKKYFDKYGIIILMSILAIFFGTRNNVAVDDLNYITMFARFSKTLEGINIHYPNIEIIMKILCRIVGLLNFNYKGIFLLYSAISFTFLGLFLKKLNLPKLDLLIFIMTFVGLAFFTYMTVMRQFLAISIALYGLSFVKEKKYKKSIILIIIASLFHNSAIIMLLLMPFFMDKVKLDYKIKIISLIVTFILGATGILNSIIAAIASILKYKHYATQQVQQVFGGVGIIHYLLFAIYVMQCWLEKENKNTEDIFLEKGQFVYLFIFFATVNSGFAIRVSYLYLIFICLLFVTFIRKINIEKIKRIGVIVICLMLIAIISKNLIDLKDSNFMSNNFSIDYFNKSRKN